MPLQGLAPKYPPTVSSVLSSCLEGDPREFQEPQKGKNHMMEEFWVLKWCLGKPPNQNPSTGLDMSERFVYIFINHWGLKIDR